MKRKVAKETEMLRKARQRKGLSQQQVAVIAGAHIRQYQRLDMGSTLSGTSRCALDWQSEPSSRLTRSSWSHGSRRSGGPYPLKTNDAH